MGGWKPVTLRAPILGGFVLISILIIIALEIMFHISKVSYSPNDGRLTFAVNVDSLSTFSIFGYTCLVIWLTIACKTYNLSRYTYLPTIIAVCYSMIWG